MDLGVNLFFEKCRPYAFIWYWATIKDARVTCNNFLSNEFFNFRYFELQLKLCYETKLPLFLHCRAAGKEMIDILHRQSDNLEAKGVIHSFDGTLEEANTFIQMGYFIGINGWYVEYILNVCKSFSEYYDLAKIQ